MRYNIKLCFKGNGKLIKKNIPADEASYVDVLTVANTLVTGFCGTYGWNFVSMEVEIAKKQTCSDEADGTR